MLLALSLILLFLFADTAVVRTLIAQIGMYGYTGAFITGIFSVSTFTVAPAYLVIFHLAIEHNTYLIVLFAAIGSVVGDLAIFRFIKDGVFDEMRTLVGRRRMARVSHLFRSRHFAWLTPAIGALIIASPLPDEVGVSLMGLTKLKTWQFMLLSFGLNCAGILAVVLAAQKLGS